MYPSGNKSLPIRTPAEVGALIRQRRTELRLTQAELALQVGVGRRFLIELEDGKATLQLGKVLQVLSMLGIAITASAS